MVKQISVLIGLCLMTGFMSGCVSKQWPKVKMTSTGLLVPVSPRWRHKDCDFTKAAILPDFNALYVHHRDDFDHYFFLRFWPGGQVSMRAAGIPGRPPTASEGDEFSLHTAVGYYCIKGNEIKIEVLGIDGIYHSERGTISKDAIAMEGLYKLKIHKKVDFGGALKKAPTW